MKWVSYTIYCVASVKDNINANYWQDVFISTLYIYFVHLD